MGRTLRLLVVEDHLDAAELLAELLVHYGHTVRIAANGSAAMTLASEHELDVVICDVGLPDMTGYELMTKLRERYPIKGIALTGATFDRQRGTTAGFSASLTKPVSMRKLQQALLDVAE